MENDDDVIMFPPWVLRPHVTKWEQNNSQRQYVHSDTNPTGQERKHCKHTTCIWTHTNPMQVHNWSKNNLSEMCFSWIQDKVMMFANCGYLKERRHRSPSHAAVWACSFLAFSAWLALLLAWYSREIKQHKTADVMEGEFRLPVHSKPKINTAQLKWGELYLHKRRFIWNRLGLLW